MKFSKAVTVTATAYTAGYDGVGTRTATGTTVHKGVAAVDKRVFPLGSDLYVVAKGMEYGLTRCRGHRHEGSQDRSVYGELSGVHPVRPPDGHCLSSGGLSVNSMN